jgi:molecular chaperone DnaK
VTPTSGLSQAEVERLVAEAERHKHADDLRRELAELRNQAETLLYTTEQALDGYANLVDEEMLEQTRTKTTELRTLLSGPSDVASIREAYQSLEAMTFAIAEKLYGGGEGAIE